MPASRSFFVAMAASSIRGMAAATDTVAMIQTQHPAPPVRKERSLVGDLAGVRYSATEQRESRVVDLSFAGPGVQVDMSIDCSTFNMRFDGGESMMTEENAKSFTSIHNSFIPNKAKPGCGAMHLLQRAAAYLATAPKGFSLGKFELPSSGIKCNDVREVVEAAWDDMSGNHTENVVAGTNATVTCLKDAQEAKALAADYECMGNCGPGCWSTKAHLKKQSVYTQDCMNHDQCSLVNCATGGKDDGNCGNEWRRAMDDYLVGILVCDSHVHIPFLGGEEE